MIKIQRRMRIKCTGFSTIVIPPEANPNPIKPYIRGITDIIQFFLQRFFTKFFYGKFFYKCEFESYYIKRDLQ